jgi:hypothetical protein
LREQDLGYMDKVIVKGPLALYETLEEQIQVFEDKITAMGMEDPQVKFLMTMPGIGYFAASMLVARAT